MRQLTIIVVTAIFGCSARSETMQSCDSLIYCQGELLHTIQSARIYKDSKTFVDMIQVNSLNKTLENFENLMNYTNKNPPRELLKKFVDENFITKGELDDWSPTDYNSNPGFLKKIDDIVVRDFARTLVSIWPKLARKVKNTVSEHPEKHSLIPVPNGFIIPGGRFTELYYWDSYWIIKGLLLSEMKETVRGMLDNFMTLVNKYGFVPNGSRVYYLNRSQPPLLSLMVGLYVDATKNLDWLRTNIGTLEEELKWWLNNRTTVVERDGVKYSLAHYACESGTPRPESYSEDVFTCAIYGDKTDKENCYKNLKGGAESGWDFSTRWIFDSEGGINSNLSHIETSRVIPVDLNSYLCKAFKEMARFYLLLGDVGKYIEWLERASSWQKSIELVLYDKDDGIWYDYDIKLSEPRKIYYPSNFAPLWSESYDASQSQEIGAKAAEYFNKLGLSEYQGGIPTSLHQSGEQWDLPDAWPPMQEVVILGLKKTGDPNAEEIANTFAKRWINANIRGYNENKEMFEKYDALHSGQYGGGGEYTVQSGFGWTNGVAFSIIENFYVNQHSNYRKSRRR